MCYSAQIEADYKKFVRMFGATIDIREFARLYRERAGGRVKAKIPKAMDDAFGSPQSDDEREIKKVLLIEPTEAARTLRAYSYQSHRKLKSKSEALSFLTSTDYKFFTLVHGEADKVFDPMQLLPAA
jgi:hypothetical protein